MTASKEKHLYNDFLLAGITYLPSRSKIYCTFGNCKNNCFRIGQNVTISTCLVAVDKVGYLNNLVRQNIVNAQVFEFLGLVVLIYNMGNVLSKFILSVFNKDQN